MDVTDRPPIVGIIRFSVLTGMLGDRWRATTRKPADVARRYLFDDSRLALRFEMFEAIALPAYDAQEAGRPFHLLVLTSTLLPERWRTRLDALAATRPYLHVLAIDPEADPEAALVGAILPIAAGHTIVATFRSDDDDAVASDYIRCLSEHLDPANVGKVVSFSNGHALASTSHPGEVILKDSHYPFIALGLAYISAADALRTVYALGSHDKIDQFPSVVDPRPGMWMRAMHTGSDSQVSPRPWYVRHFTDEEQRIPAATAAERLGERFGFLDVARAAAILARSRRRDEAERGQSQPA